MPTRRPHSKSRRGCTPCKARHLKCNEARPACSRCREVNRECFYQAHDPACHQDANQETSLSTGRFFSSSSHGPALPIAPSTSSINFGLGNEGSVYNIEHFRLLDNFDLVVRSGTDPAGQQQRKEYMQTAFKFPFLLDQMLALSEAHMSVNHTESGAVNATEATFLQTRALQQFNSFQAMESDSEEQRKAVFLYSSLLSMHALFGALIMCQSDEPQKFLDRFAFYISIQRGVAAIASEPGSWNILKDHASMVLGSASLTDFEAPNNGHECEALYGLVEASNLDPARRETLVQVIKSLQWAFDIQRRVCKHGSEHGVTAVLAWACCVPNEFISMLKQQVPEALVMLAYYTVILHRAREHWAVRDAGQQITKGVSSWLGSFWAKWLSWPLENMT